MTVNDLSAQSNLSQTTVETIQDGIVANTVKLFSDSEIAKQNFVMIEKRFDMLAEQKKEDRLPPTQPELIVQTLETENKENVKLEDSTSLSVVLKRQSKGSQTMENAQSNDFIETRNKGNLVSIVSEPDSQVTRRQSTNLKLAPSPSNWMRLNKRNSMG